jgi:putative transcriptional regulator
MEAKFVCNLKKYRVAQELTQEQLADIVGVRRETIMRLEKAQYNPSPAFQKMPHIHQR